jgi:Ni,Fe-hydrogenase I large subunit
MTRRVVGPFNRVEGDLEIALDVSDGVVTAAYVNAPMYRGFEQMLLDKVPADALVLVPRICGICSVAQSAAASRALASACGAEPPPNGRLAANLTQAAENAADHLTHFYLFFMPDFANSAYRDRPWFEETANRFRAIQGTAAAEVLAGRTAFMRVMSLLAGKWPHTLSLQPGGSSRSLQTSEKIRLFRTLREFRDFLERVVYGDSLEHVTALATRDELAAWAETHADRADFARFLRIAADLRLHELGRNQAVMMSAGAYQQEAGMLFAQGVWSGQEEPLDPGTITEDVRFSHYCGDARARAPEEGETLPQMGKEGAYSWCKAPRLKGRVAETGALARQVVARHPLARDLVSRDGGNVMARIVARLLELARLVPAMESWAQELRPGEPYHIQPPPIPESADAFSLIEAARGTLGHWMSVRNGRLRNYQIIAPTTWNFSPRDANGTPGAVEQALVGTPARDSEGGTAPAVYHVVRSFDPCMVCTVH